MKRLHTTRQAAHPRRGGAVIIVVLALLASLAFLGFFFYSWSDQEARSARAFAFERAQELQADDPIDDFLRQVIMSTPEERTQSALHGGQYTSGTTTIQVSDKSLLAHTLGLITADGTPEETRLRNGRGIAVVWNDTSGDGLPQASEYGFDYNGDGVYTEATAASFRFNFSAAANATPTDPFERVATIYEAHRPDVDYTYPDLNSPFLAYDSVLPDGTRVLTPSYFRPQLFPDRRGGGNFGDLYTSGATATQVLRPHMSHVNSDGTARYLSAATTAVSGDPNRIIQPFPFTVDQNSNGTANEMGVFSGPGAIYELDVDADGDGTLDSIWIDGDHPIIDLADGRQAVPIFYVKIIDADALLNLNHHGHDPALVAFSNSGTANHVTQVYNWPGWIHASHLGMSPAEVNLLPALRADPNDPAYIAAGDVAAATLAHRGWYNGAAGAFNRGQMANTELARLLHGSPRYRDDGSGNPTLDSPNPGTDIPGRYGETVVSGTPVLRNALSNPGAATFPSAGATLQDDDGDDNNPANNLATSPANNYGSGIAHTDSTTGLVIPPAVHPLDFTGIGNHGPAGSLTYLLDPGCGGRRILAGRSDSLTNPSQWLKYGTATGFATWQNQDYGGAPVAGIVPWTRGAVPGDLQSNSYDGLFNENDEIVTDNSFPSAADDPFSPQEMPALQLSDSDWQAARSVSRARNLASFNFEANLQAAAIRQQFTTDSRDRLEHGYRRPVGTRGTWEFNDLTPASGLSRFPPKFGATGGPFGLGHTSRHEGVPAMQSVPLVDPNDPFRPVVRRLLSVEEFNTTNISSTRWLPGQRLNINRLLAHFDASGNPIYRRLTPHAEFTGTETDSSAYLVDGSGAVRPLHHDHIAHNFPYYLDGAPLTQLEPQLPAVAPYAAVPFDVVDTDLFAREAWARADRQRLARDIFVLLYTLGGPDGVDPTTAAYTGPDSDGNGVVDLVQAMAQFAVNYVDALDQDNVITRFEYDSDLSDGWSVDPDPDSRLFVNGVEAAGLTWSEALWIRTTDTNPDQDFADSIHNDGDREHQYLYMELRNASPFTIPLGSGSYRIVRTETDGTQTNAVEFRSATPGGLRKQVPAGENFLVATHDGSVTVHQSGSPDMGDVRSSDFYINVDGDPATFEAIVPNGPAAGDPATTSAPLPLCDLDLCYADPTHQNYYAEQQINTLTPSLGNKLVGLSLPTDVDSTSQFVLVLQRQRNPLSGGLFGDSEWVEVDRIAVNVQQYAPTSDATVVTQLNGLQSDERRQPLALTSGTDEDTSYTMDGEDWAFRSDPHNGTGTRNHTLDVNGANKHVANSQQTSPFDVWQPHFDRDFSSAYEVLSVPVFAPARLVERLADDTRRLSGVSADLAGSANVVPSIAAGIFMNPQLDIDGDGTDDENRWYRFFEFVEYPPRTHDTIRDNLTLRRRTDGRLNLNTLRHEHVLAGLVDDLVQLENTAAASPTIDRHDAVRVWYHQMLAARDGLDPFTSAAGQNITTLSTLGLTGLPLPGVPGAQPFRSQSYIDPVTPNASVQHTLLRGHYPSGTALDGLRLFEARGTTDVGTDDVDYHTRNRLLAKIANNSTNRSHVYILWVGYELFEAHQPNAADPDVVQIGAKIDDVPGHRDFVVVDMTRIEEAYTDSNLTDTLAGRFDWRKFIIYRKRIQ